MDKYYHPGRCNYALSWNILVHRVNDAINHDNVAKGTFTCTVCNLIQKNVKRKQCFSVTGVNNFTIFYTYTVMNDWMYICPYMKGGKYFWVECRISVLSENINSASELYVLSWHEPKGIVVFMRFNLVCF